MDLAVGHLYSSIHALDPTDHIDAEIISRVANVVPRIRKKGGQQDFTLGAQEVRQDMNILKKIRHDSTNLSQLHQSHRGYHTKSVLSS